MQQPQKAIFVALPLEGGEGPLAFAVAEPRRSGAPIRLVHVLALSAGESYVGVYNEAIEASQSAVYSAGGHTLEMCGPRTPLTSEMVDSGWTVGELVARSLTARMVVLKHRTLGRVKRLLIGSISNGVASRARSAVVPVPAGWTPESGSSPDRFAVVTPVVAMPSPSRISMRRPTSFGQDSRPPGNDEIFHRAARLVDEQRVRRPHRHPDRPRHPGSPRSTGLGPVVAELQEVCMTGKVTTEIVHAPALVAVLDAAERADLLVLRA